MERVSGKLGLVGRALEPIHHGEGVSGNMQILRTQRIYSETIGDFIKLPFISGNSLKHMIRVNATQFAIDAMDIKDKSLTKAVVHLLFSGGALGKTGSTVRLDVARQIEEIFPSISLCGYSASNNMQPSKLRLDHLHLVCLENVFRMPEDLKNTSESQRRAAEFRGEDFGTRHEPTRVDHIAQRLLLPDEKEITEKQLSGQVTKLKQGVHREKQNGSAQMIYDFEVVLPGSLWWGGLWFSDLTSMEMTALKTALEYAARDKVADGIMFFVGAKTSVGYGRMSFSFNGSLRRPRIPEYEESHLPVPTKDVYTEDNKKYVEHLRHNKDRIMDLLKAVAK